MRESVESQGINPRHQKPKSRKFNVMSNQIAALNNDQIQRLAPSVFAGHAHSEVSSRYSFLPTITVVEGMRSAGWMPVKAQEQRIRESGRAGFQKHTLRFQRAQDIESYSSREMEISARRVGMVTPEIVLVNSHDRTSAYQLHAGLFRLVCLKGMTVADSTIERVSITHVDFDPAAVIAASLRIAGEVPRLMNRVEEFKAHQLTETERRAFAESAILLKYEDLEVAPVSAQKLLAVNRSEDNGADLWRTFNTVQENLVRGGQKDYGKRVPTANGRTRRAPRTRAVDSIDSNIKLNKALWHLAEVLKAGGQPSDAAGFNAFAN